MDSGTPGHTALPSILLHIDQGNNLLVSLRSIAEIPLSFSKARFSYSVFRGIIYNILNYKAFVISV